MICIILTRGCDSQNQIGHAHRIAVHAKFLYFKVQTRINIHGSLITHSLPLRTKELFLTLTTLTLPHRAHSKKTMWKSGNQQTSLALVVFIYYGHHSHRERACRVSCSILLAGLSAKGPGILWTSLCKGSQKFFSPKISFFICRLVQFCLCT